MKVRLLFSISMILVSFSLAVAQTQQKTDSVIKPSKIDLNEWIEQVVEKQRQDVKFDSVVTKSYGAQSQPETGKLADLISDYYIYHAVSEASPVVVDTLFIQANPLLIDLVYRNPEFSFSRNDKLYPYKVFFGVEPASLTDNLYKPREVPSSEKIIADLRNQATKKLALTAPKIFVYRAENLPGTDDVKSRIIHNDDLSRIQFADVDRFRRDPKKKIEVAKAQAGPWTKKANILMQFSQNMVSNNWYQGGNSNMAVLGVLTGQLNYDNKKNIQFENNAEWRMGFYFVDDTTALRTINVNNDLLKINSKMGLKLSGNWYYSGSVDFSTQFLNNYKAVNSNDLKATFLTPIRLNVGIGLDYKYKKLFSLALSPLAYKYIYINETDETKINPNLFGIEKGKNHLSEVGSSFKALLAYSPFRELQVNSTLSFYTNYEKVEIDWEIVGNFTINRFLSTRLSLNPRYDNTVILAGGEKAQLQFKELLSFGFSYKLLN